MKIAIIVIVSLLFPLGLTRSQDNQNTDNYSFEEPASEHYDNDDNEGSVMADFQLQELNAFSKKLYQKALKPLSRKDKIKWSFKMADSDIFL